MDKFLEVNHITKFYGKVKALDDISFWVKQKEIFGLLGANGSGKSSFIKTLLKIIDSGPNDTGTITVNDKDNIKIGYVAENRAILENLTGEEFIDFVLSINHVNSTEKKEFYLKRFDMYEKKNELIRYYSNGMKKKILIISALSISPDLLIVDEPFAALDPEGIHLLKQVLKDISKEGCTVMICSHTLDVLEEIVDSLIILRKGKMLYFGEKKELFYKMNSNKLEECYIKVVQSESMEEE
ncbi:ABC-2 type transport system ATP-binding protein [Lachnotalea glycerini]|uniref:ABC-2 type transport system ATP-binding protein n=1 Tax=Lachnotalea glycerini TaxID=1763509 RepID=A0A318EPF6_9FIRM|nr:ABC transporter ATP-binding protein [Lachnotalea glycerini]PXV93345.1 ABC-2 type transport system ATP-binding protein [Lachnotalea glycerini]